MNKNNLLLLLFLLPISLYAIGQEQKLEDLTIGFACGIAAQTTPLVDHVADLIKAKAYSEIKKLLYTKNSGEMYLAIIILERLVEKKLYKLNEKEKTFISKIKASNIIVYNCLGCFKQTNLMRELFKKEDLIEEKKWLNQLIPMK
ncbi:hypothetical protein KO494_01880 [Lacinutrix sp. C3R15]|uniref:hypothetical protein n=1 Tax=Flavobacteriaceae TaxID=49546 RepID=UPI001C084D63|nr:MULTISPECIES: hypothetical protein [Flavobacteriaceae]MBU2938279.1 hypothetical protein [Lacinutrix sp. C3R15]MDO6621593.1 hypothetical protein [Oceanihabitans sp. 1_MG-2023]